MQMLSAAGLPLFCDETREADVSNPNGYFELDAVKRLAADHSWLAGARGQVVKIVTPLLLQLPATETYRVLMLHRNWEEILASQCTMRQRVEPEFQMAAPVKKMLVETFVKQEKRALSHLEQVSGSTVLHLEHSDLIHRPETVAPLLSEFLSVAIDPISFSKPVNRSLYRNRA
ncbi:hypothetical protein [Thalassobacterium maritimum]|nr:hypothetical protein [Coraliomargarita sp. SDUM461003]